jgi:hypothetical protein
MIAAMPKRSILLLFYILSKQVSGQPIDSSVYESTGNAINIYYQSLREESPLYNGSEYLEYAYTIQEGDPFFETSNWVNGTIYFEGMIFQNVPMLYDIVKDQVIIRDFQKVYKINLPADKVQQFTLPGHNFVRLTHGQSDQIKTGFYEQLYNGKIQAFAKREKKLIEKYGGLQIYNVVISQSRYYIKKDGYYYSVNNKRELLNIFKDKKKNVQQYLKKIGIKFKSDPATVIALVAEYYDKLN